MVGPGTGIAPFVSFLEFRETYDKSDNLVFFGACFKNKEFYFKEYFEKLTKDEKLTLYTAFSRD